jgi:hypothetical protein
VCSSYCHVRSFPFCAAAPPQAGLAAAQAALATAPADPQLQAELRYAAAAAQLWGSVQECGDPAWFPALERYAQALEVGGCSALLAGAPHSQLVLHMCCTASMQQRGKTVLSSLSVAGPCGCKRGTAACCVVNHVAR